jgi:hypothetical protein
LYILLIMTRQHIQLLLNLRKQKVRFDYLRNIFNFEQVIRYILVWDSLRLINREAVYEKRKSFQTSTCITCSNISNIPYKWIFKTKFNDSSILIRIISWDYFNLSLANEYVGDVTIPTQNIKYSQLFPRQIRQSNCSIHIKLNYLFIKLPGCTTRCK